MLLHLALLSATTAPPRSVIRVQNWLSSNPDASMLPAAACSPTIRYSNNDLPGCTLEGADAYSAASRAWHNDCCELLGPSYTTTVQRVAQLSSPDEVAVRWRAEWSPDAFLLHLDAKAPPALRERKASDHSSIFTTTSY